MSKEQLWKKYKTLVSNTFTLSSHVFDSLLHNPDFKQPRERFENIGRGESAEIAFNFD